MRTKKTFTTTMPDRVGAFLKADECLTRYGLNITRVSYNKAVDTHMLFLEAEGEEEMLTAAEAELAALGYLQEEIPYGSVVLLEFTLPDRPGTLLPILRLIHRFGFNISYISSRQDESDFQAFKMGLFVEKGKEVSEFIRRAALLCPVRVIDYDKSEKVLDNTVFYLSFSDNISQKLGLTPREKRHLLINANRIMQVLDERNSPAYKTFDYIGRFADFLKRHEKENYRPRITRYTEGGLPVTLIEPPCGSNTCVIVRENTLLAIDCGFARYRKEWEETLQSLFPALDSMTKILLLTHADVDHCGCLDFFDRVVLSRVGYDNFRREREGLPALREENPLHRPYVRISKILSCYRPPADKRERYIVLDPSLPSQEAHVKNAVSEEKGAVCAAAIFRPVVRKSEGCGARPETTCGGTGVPSAVSAAPREGTEGLFVRLPDVTVCGLRFEAYEGKGGHVPGEVVFLQREHRLAFTGDIFVHIKGFSKEQAAFNRLAPYLMTAVDSDPALAKAEREALFRLLSPGVWQIFGGHGGVYRLEADARGRDAAD